MKKPWGLVIEARSIGKDYIQYTQTKSNGLLTIKPNQRVKRKRNRGKSLDD